MENRLDEDKSDYDKSCYTCRFEKVDMLDPPCLKCMGYSLWTPIPIIDICDLNLKGGEKDDKG